MVRFETAVVLLLHLLQNGDAFSPSARPTKHKLTRNEKGENGYPTTRRVASSMPGEGDRRTPNVSDLYAVSNMTSTYIKESMSMDADDEEEALYHKREQREANLMANGVFRVQFKSSDTWGISVVQVRSGRKISDMNMDLDTLVVEKADGGRTDGMSRQRMDWPTVAGQLDAGFKGLLVASVAQGSAAWVAGVRAGDVVKAASATIGDALWPATTIDGLQSALRSRKRIAVDASTFLEFQRISDTVDNRFELTLKRPLGLEIKENADGFVEVTGFNENASRLVRHAVRVGDLITAVDSSLGDRLWPVSTVEGLVSACTARLPGQPVRLELQRPVENLQNENSVDASLSIAQSAEDSILQDNIEERVIKTDSNLLLKRCRDVLKRYATTGTDRRNKSKDFKDKYGVPAIVADKVVDALASARVVVDPITLSMIMRAYLSCYQPQQALDVFEAAVGFSSDGSASSRRMSLIGENGAGLIPNESALDLFTGTALIQAHAMKGDIFSVSRVLAALEGRSGVLVGGKESAPWPFTGTYGTIQLDTNCYNVAMSAAQKIGGMEAVEMALALFRSMSDSKGDGGISNKPCRNVVSYNTILSTLANAGRSLEAFRVFDRMKASRVRPDKYSYTALIRACRDEDDVRELLIDMKDRNVKADTVMYNSMIKSLCEKRKWTEATKLVVDMESQGISPDSMTYSFLMSAMMKAKKPNACLSLFESASAAAKTAPLMQNVHLYTTAISAASSLANYERALELVARMKVNGVKPNLKTLTSVMGACLAGKKYDLAANLFRQVERPDGYAMTQGIRALCGDGQVSEALTMVKKSNAKKCRLTGKERMQCYEAILISSIRTGDLDTAEMTIRDLLKRGFIPNKAMLDAMIRALGLFSSKGVAPIASENEVIAFEKFRFLLITMDLLGRRNLPIEGSLYQSVISLAALLGGSPKRVASLMTLARANTKEKALLSESGSQVEKQPKQSPSDLTWLAVLTLVENEKNEVDTEILPSLSVRIRNREVRRTVALEQKVLSMTPKKRSSRKKQRVGAAR